MIIDSKDLEVLQVGCALRCSDMEFATRINLHACLCACALQVRVNRAAAICCLTHREISMFGTANLVSMSKAATAQEKSCEVL